MRSLHRRPGSRFTTSSRSAGLTRWLGILAFTAASISACADVTDPVAPDTDPRAAVPSGPSMSLSQTLSGCNGAAPLRTIQATPSNYRSLIAGLIPGDRLLLAAGTYGHLPLHDKHGEPGKCIVIEGPASGSSALFLGSDSWNIISLKDASYITLRNLSLDGQGKGGNGVKAEFGAVSVHHVLIEGLSLKNFNGVQGVAISTKAPAWNWVVRGSTITSTYTGMYLGNSDGTAETTNFLVEHNLVHGTLGYNIQFKHQLGRNTSIGMPTSGTTIIRHNTFSKETGSITGPDARPNLLVGHWPLSGAGSTDIYQVYGNLFYLNPTEALFQGEGNIALHDNLFVNRAGTAVRIQAQYSVPRRVEVFNNTVVASGTGISISGADAAYTQRVMGNAVFAGTPLTGGQQSNNVTGTYAAASTYLNNPMAALGSGLDLYPKTGQLQGTAIDYSYLGSLEDRDRDFNGTTRAATYRGAYSGSGTNPGWTPALAIKPAPSTGNPPPPPPSAGVLQNGVAVSGLSGATGSQQFWTITVPAGATSLQFQTSGGSGDADLYVRHGSAPTTDTYDCGPVTSDNNETCSFASPAAGTWHVMVHGYGAYSGATLVGSYQTGTGNPPPPPSAGVLQNGVPVSGLSGATDSQRFWTITVPAGATSLQFQTSGGSGDADLYVRHGSAPTTDTYDCGPVTSDNNETCSFASPAAGTWHVMVHGYGAYSGATLVGSYQTCNSIPDAEPNDSRAAAQVLSGSCTQVSGTFLNDASTQQNDFFRLSVPAGKTVTALLDGLSVDYDLYLYDAAGNQVGSSENGGTSADQLSYSNGNASAVDVYILVWRYASTRTTYQLKVSY